MTGSRRAFFRTSLGAGLLAAADARAAAAAPPAAPKHPAPGELDRIAAEPVLRTELLKTPIVVASMELLRNGPKLPGPRPLDRRRRERRRPQRVHIVHIYPLFLARVAPFFVGKDARELEPLLWELYRQDNNYKYQGLGALGLRRGGRDRAAGPARATSQASRRRPAGAASGGARSPSTGPAATAATRPRRRSTTCSKLVAETGAKALKFRLGGRMSRNADSLPGPDRAADPAGPRGVRRRR